MSCLEAEYENAGGASTYRLEVRQLYACREVEALTDLLRQILLMESEDSKEDFELFSGTRRSIRRQLGS